jgi:hypothetical protein
MKKYLTGIGFLLTLSLLLICSCEQKPKQCTTCNGMGNITQSVNAPLPFRVVSCNVRNSGFFSPDYYVDIVIENQGNEDGTFTAYVDFIYKNIGKHTENGEVFVRAHSQATKTVHYDADKSADRYEYRVVAPEVIQTHKTICPTCGGTGLVK